MQLLACRADVHIQLGIIEKVLLAKEGRALGQVSDGDVGFDVLPFNCHDVVSGTIFGISRYMARPQFPAEAGAEDEIAHGLIVHHFRRGH
jgi:hypothetical protein